jgi:hypothetical protein
MKLFTVDEANATLPLIVPKLERIRSLYAALAEMRDPAKDAAAASEFGGGMAGGSRYVKTLYEIGKLTTELSDTGIELKDYTRGLIDFPSLLDDRVVYLCWQIGEPMQLRWWHEIDAGFAGRTPL